MLECSMSRVLLSCVLCLTATAVYGQDLVIPARLSLEEALRLTTERNPNLAAARNSVEVAEAGRVGAQLRPNGALTFESGSYPLFESPRPSFFGNQEMTLRFDQEIELSGRRRLRTQTADADVLTAEASFDDQRRRLEFEVRRAYFAVVLAKADVDVSQAALEEIDRVIGLNRARYEQGEISGGELRRVQVERLKFVDDLFAGQLALKNARSALLALFNAPNLSVEFDVSEPLSIAAPSAGAPPVTLDPVSLRTQALSMRPDLLAAQRAVQRADTETSLQRALHTPNITVGGGYRRDFGSDGVVFGVTVPLAFSNRNQGGIARAEAERRQAANVAAATAVSVSLDVQQAINAVDISRARVQYIESEYLTPARESRDIVLAAYRLGTADLIDFLDAQRAFRDTARTYNRALYDQRISLFQLSAATGVAGSTR
jgi:cobalt-zinc-cadmium efflux system outer membrane protein